MIAGGGVRAVLELGGVKDVLTKSIGTQNPINLVKATMDGLVRLRRPEEVAELRGLTVSQVLGLDGNNGAGTRSTCQRVLSRRTTPRPRRLRARSHPPRHPLEPPHRLTPKLLPPRPHLRAPHPLRGRSPWPSRRLRRRLGSRKLRRLRPLRRPPRECGEIEQVRSANGTNPDQKATLAALGLGRIGKSVELKDSPQLQGQLRVVSHLVEVS